MREDSPPQSCVYARVQVDPSGSGRVAANDAALFLKRSGLSDLVLGKVISNTVHIYNHFRHSRNILWDIKVNILT